MLRLTRGSKWMMCRHCIWSGLCVWSLRVALETFLCLAERETRDTPTCFLDLKVQFVSLRVIYSSLSISLYLVLLFLFLRASTCRSCARYLLTPTRPRCGLTWCASSAGITSSWSWAMTTRAARRRRSWRRSWRRGRRRWETLGCPGALPPARAQIVVCLRVFL